MSKPMTVWYKIDHPDLPHCAEPMVFTCNLEPLTAEQVARSFYGELRFMFGDGVKAVVWAE